ncbi:hypothetical protein BJ741DRAFT_653873 [Chytriomyces cf. hyalinus JEL632]|nr:hypothetical protein BJ741DRAFT_653873 [Chytriomyces cf. hyalinus JEL632]
MIAIALLVAAQAAYALSDTAGLGFSFTATSSDPTSATVCINGKVAQNNYIGFGIATSVDSAAGMTGADLTVVYADDAGKVQLISATAAAGHAFTPVTSVKTLTAASSYTNGELTACFTRSMDANGSGSLALVNGPGGYIWSTGSIVSGSPTHHTQKGKIPNAMLFAAAAGSAAPSSAAAAPTTAAAASGAAPSAAATTAGAAAAAASKSSSAENVLVSAFAVILSALVY